MAFQKQHYQHDCNKCIYLGDYTLKDTIYDLYWCDSSILGASLISRYDNEGPDYFSSHTPDCFAAGFQPGPLELQILSRALLKGLYCPWKKINELKAKIALGG